MKMTNRIKRIRAEYQEAKAWNDLTDQLKDIKRQIQEDCTRCNGLGCQSCWFKFKPYYKAATTGRLDYIDGKYMLDKKTND